MKYQVFFKHGFNVGDRGVGTIGKLSPYFAAYGLPYNMMSYGWFGLGSVYARNDGVAKELARACRNANEHGHGVIVVAHSNGCAITHIAAEKYGATIARAVYINPALEKDIEIPPSIASLHVWHSPSDKPVKFAKWLPGLNWGEMGATGYTGEDERVENFDKENDFPVESDKHSDIFSPGDLAFFGPIISETTMSGLDLENHSCR